MLDLFGFQDFGGEVVGAVTVERVFGEAVLSRCVAKESALDETLVDLVVLAVAAALARPGHVQSVILVGAGLRFLRRAPPYDPYRGYSFRSTKDDPVQWWVLGHVLSLAASTIGDRKKPDDASSCWRKLSQSAAISCSRSAT